MNSLLTDPELSDILNMLKRDILLNLNCHHVGTIQSFNPANQTANATINYKKQIQVYDSSTQTNVNQLVDYPPIYDAPVIFLRGGAASLTFPINIKDECDIFFNDRDLDNWFNGSVIGAPASPQLHEFTDAIILVGARSSGNVLANFDMTRALLQWAGGGQVGVGPQLVRIANSTYTLNGLLQELITEIKQITVLCAGSGSPSGPPINIAALTATALKIQELLE